MPDTSTDLQVENETAEVYRGVMIFRTLHEGQIVYKGGKTRIFPKQYFYALVPDTEDTKNEKPLVYHDVEGVRSLIDSMFPGTGLVQAPV